MWKIYPATSPIRCFNSSMLLNLALNCTCTYTGENPRAGDERSAAPSVRSTALSVLHVLVRAHILLVASVAATIRQG